MIGDQDDLLRDLLAPLANVESVRLSRSSRRYLVFALVGFLTVFAVAGIGLAARIGPFAGIAAADRPATAGDTLDRSVVRQLRSDELPPSNPVDQIGKREIALSRFVGTLPTGDSVFVVPTTRGKLCVVVANKAESCGDPLSQEAPITFTISDDDGPRGWKPAIAWGVARDGVVSVSFAVGGRFVTVPVHNNFFAFEANPWEHGFANLTAQLADGSAVSLE